MKFHYHPETDSLYIEFEEGPGVETREILDGLNIDIDASGEVVGFDIDHLSQLAANLAAMEVEALPLRPVLT